MESTPCAFICSTDYLLDQGWADLLVEAITTVNFAADGSQNPTTGLGALEHMDMRTFISIRQDRRYPARESLLYLDEERHCARSYP